MIEDHQVQRILVEGGSSSEIMYEYCFRNLSVNIRSRLRKCRAPLIGFSGETYHPLGIIDLRVTMGKAGRNKTVLMEFAIVKCRSSYNVIIGRTGMRSLIALERVQGSWKEVQWRQREEKMSRIREQAIRRINIGQEKHRGNIHHQPRMSEPARNNGDRVDSRLQTVVNKRAPRKHRGIRMGRVRKNFRTAIRHGASTKDIPSRRADGP
ncbi:hypothetical protein Tco_1164450 [Tanacetum coccineum]